MVVMLAGAVLGGECAVRGSVPSEADEVWGESTGVATVSMISMSALPASVPTLAFALLLRAILTYCGVDVDRACTCFARAW